MKEEAVDRAMDNMVAGRTNNRCQMADAVYNFLSDLIEDGNWVERQILRTVRGFVASWRLKKCYR